MAKSIGWENMCAGCGEPRLVYHETSDGCLLCALCTIDHLRTENERLREALVALLDTAIILSDEYLDLFKGKSDKDTVYTFSMGQWRQLSVAAKQAHTALDTAVTAP